MKSAKEGFIQNIRNMQPAEPKIKKESSEKEIQKDSDDKL